MQDPKDFIREKEIGEITVILPEPPVKSRIANHELPDKEQKFRRVAVPNNLYSPKEGYIYTEEDKNFLKEEIRKCKEGYWFYNNGVIEYITGSHYFYVNFWNIDIGLASYRDADRDVFLYFNHCIENPKCLGIVLIGGRRMGKTAMSCCLIYHQTIFNKHGYAHSGIQSKTSQDAKQVFTKMIGSWKRLPDFLKPADSGDKNPKTALRFEEPSTRNLKGQKKVYKDYINSYIDYQSTVETAYDGSKLLLYYLDEFGKTLEMNVHETWNITKECLVTGQNIVGKAILTTTVEEMEKKGGLNAKKIWDESDPRDIQKNGRTASGLFRYFRPAFMGYEGCIDEYGNSEQEKAIQIIKDNRESMKGHALASEIRKYPIEVNECWRIDKGSVFDINNLHSQLEYNSGILSPVVRGSFTWTEEYKSVRWMPQENGRWQMFQIPEPEKSNNVFFKNGMLAPNNKNLYVAGCDPIDQSVTFSNHTSDAASHVFRLKDPMQELGTNCFIAQYCTRPPKAEEFFEDMLMQCIFYGCQVLVESNRPGMIEYFKRKGMQNFLMQRPDVIHKGKMQYGIPMSGNAARSALIRAIQTYIYDHVGFVEEENRYSECYFDDLLDDWIKFETDAWTKYDLTVSSGLTLLAADNLLNSNFDKSKNRSPIIPVRRYR